MEGHEMVFLGGVGHGELSGIFFGLTRVTALMDPNERIRYVEPMKDEVVRGWDHAYNI